MIVTAPSFDLMCRIPEQLKLRTTHPECYAGGFTAATGQAMLKFSEDAIEALKNKKAAADAPAILVCQGDDDSTTTLEGAQMVVDWSGNKDKEMKVYKDRLLHV